MPRRADRIEAQIDASIYDNDPDAIESLEYRIAGLEAPGLGQWRSTRRPEGLLRLLTLAGASARVLADPFALGDAAYRRLPAYATSNLSDRISKDRDRLSRSRREQVERLTVTGDSPFNAEHVQAEDDDDPGRGMLTSAEANEIRAALAEATGFLQTIAEHQQHRRQHANGLTSGVTLAYRIVRAAHDRR